MTTIPDPISTCSTATSPPWPPSASTAAPELSEVWFLAEDGIVRLSLSTARQKLKNLSENVGALPFPPRPGQPLPLPRDPGRRQVPRTRLRLR